MEMQKSESKKFKSLLSCINYNLSSSLGWSFLKSISIIICIFFLFFIEAPTVKRYSLSLHRDNVHEKEQVINPEVFTKTLTSSADV